MPGVVLPYAVGDGNHSMATAKAYWEDVKKGLSAAEQADHPARYALVEVVNIHDESLIIEPIHRVVFGVETDALFGGLAGFYAGQGDRKSTRLNSSHTSKSRMPSSA